MAEWDVAIIGGGPAGLAAAAAAAGAGARSLLFDGMGGGGALMNLTAPLHGLPEPVTGPDLAAQLLEAALAAGAELAVEAVTGLAPDAAGWRVTTGEAVRTARAVILAIGLGPGRLGVAGEEGFMGRGLSHCAACDGPLYRGQDVVVAGADRWAVQEALDLRPIAAAVTLVTQGPASVTAPGVRVLPGPILGLEGAAGLEAVRLRDPAGGELRLPARAVFVQHGRRPVLDFAGFGLACVADGRIVVDAALRCAAPGLMAIGAARAGSADTLAEAMAEGRQAGAALAIA